MSRAQHDGTGTTSPDVAGASTEPAKARLVLSALILVAGVANLDALAHGASA